MSTLREVERSPEFGFIGPNLEYLRNIQVVIMQLVSYTNWNSDKSMLGI